MDKQKKSSFMDKMKDKLGSARDPKKDVMEQNFAWTQDEWSSDHQEKEYTPAGPPPPPNEPPEVIPDIAGDIKAVEPHIDIRSDQPAKTNEEEASLGAKLKKMSLKDLERLNGGALNEEPEETIDHKLDQDEHGNNDKESQDHDDEPSSWGTSADIDEGDQQEADREDFQVKSFDQKDDDLDKEPDKEFDKDFDDVEDELIDGLIEQDEQDDDNEIGAVESDAEEEEFAFHGRDQFAEKDDAEDEIEDDTEGEIEFGTKIQTKEQEPPRDLVESSKEEEGLETTDDTALKAAFEETSFVNKKSYESTEPEIIKADVIEDAVIAASDVVPDIEPDIKPELEPASELEPIVVTKTEQKLETNILRTAGTAAAVSAPAAAGFFSRWGRGKKTPQPVQSFKSESDSEKIPVEHAETKTLEDDKKTPPTGEELLKTKAEIAQEKRTKRKRKATVKPVKDKRSRFGTLKPIIAGAKVAIDSHTFIPLARYTLLTRFEQDDVWGAGQTQDGREVLELLYEHRHLSYMPKMRELKRSYLPFSPDGDTKKVYEYTGFEKDEMRKTFFKGIETVLTQANYAKLKEEQLNLLLSSNNPYGLQLEVDLEEFDNVEIFFRGNHNCIAYKRDWKWLFLRKRAIITPTFQRLFMAFKLKPDAARLRELRQQFNISEKQAIKDLKKRRGMIPDGVTGEQIYLKLFKELAQDDLEMMFPNTKVAFKLFDKLKLGVTAGGGTMAGAGSLFTKLLAATNPIALATGLFALAGLITRQVTKFFNQRNQYMMVLAQNLYFHNLANNRGALTLVFDRAEEEDVKEELLLYNFLVRHEGPARLPKISQQIEAFLKDEWAIDIEFDAEDALGRLVDMGLVTVSGDELTAVSPAAARRLLADKCAETFLEHKKSPSFV